MSARPDLLARASYDPDSEPLAHALAWVIDAYHDVLGRRDRVDILQMEAFCMRQLADGTPLAGRPDDAHIHGLDTREGRLRHAIAWTLDSVRGNLAGRATPATQVFAFAENTLREDGRTPA